MVVPAIAVQLSYGMPANITQPITNSTTTLMPSSMRSATIDPMHGPSGTRSRAPSG